jgi:predicted O-methyltransferase YrrM
VAYDADWSAAPDFLRLIVDHALNTKPLLIVECGCGVSTLMLARCCALNGTGEVVSLEQGAEYAARARAELQRYGLAEHTRVIDAPTREYPFAGDRFAWYDFEGLPDAPIDMLVIDGPPGFSRRHARYPALPLLFERLADDCIIFLDDAARPDEREIVALWLKRHPELLSDYLKLERGCAILRLKRPTGDTNECR